MTTRSTQKPARSSPSKKTTDAPHHLLTKKKAPRKGCFSDWCTMAIQIRTGIILLNCSFYIVERDSFCAILVVEGDDHFVIVQVNRIDENIDQPLPVILPGNIQLAEFMQPEGDELCTDPRFCDLLIGDLDFQILFGAFQFL